MPRGRPFLPLLYGRRLVGRSVLTKVDLRSLAFFSVMLVLTGLAGWLYLRQTSEVAAYAHEIRELEAQKERLHRQIVSLRAEVALLGSLQRVYAEGARLGYRLPEASDTAHRLHLVYQPPQPTPVGASSAEEGELSGASGLRPPWRGLGEVFQRLWVQFREWLASSSGDQTE